MSLVTLVSGGLDSSLMALWVRDSNVEQLPLFVDYGQKARLREWAACQRVLKAHRLPTPQRVNLEGFGRLLPSGLTNAKRDLLGEAFLPGRNLLFLLVAAAYAASRGAGGVAIGLLNERQRVFADQSVHFLEDAQRILRIATANATLRVVAPLMTMTKVDVLRLAEERRILGTYSCHAGKVKPCGRCISCREVANARG